MMESVTGAWSRFSRIVGLAPAPPAVDLTKSEQPNSSADLDILQPASRTRVVTEAGGLTLATGAAVGLLVTAPVGLIAGTLAGLFWGVRRYITARSEGELKECLQRYDDLREQIVVATPDELIDTRKQITEARSLLAQAGFNDMYYSLHILALETLIEKYEHDLGPGIRASGDGQEGSSLLVAPLIAALNTYATNRCATNRQALVEQAQAITLPLARCGYLDAKASAARLKNAMGLFDKCELKETYLSTRVLLLNKVASRLKDRAFSLADLSDAISDTDDINF